MDRDKALPYWMLVPCFEYYLDQCGDVDEFVDWCVENWDDIDADDKAYFGDRIKKDVMKIYDPSLRTGGIHGDDFRSGKNIEGWQKILSLLGFSFGKPKFCPIERICRDGGGVDTGFDSWPRACCDGNLGTEGSIPSPGNSICREDKV